MTLYSPFLLKPPSRRQPSTPGLETLDRPELDEGFWEDEEDTEKTPMPIWDEPAA